MDIDYKEIAQTIKRFWAGKGITIYDMSGRVVAKGSLHNGCNTISVPKGSPVIVKIDGCAAVKAM